MSNVDSLRHSIDSAYKRCRYSVGSAVWQLVCWRVFRTSLALCRSLPVMPEEFKIRVSLQFHRDARFVLSRVDGPCGLGYGFQFGGGSASCELKPNCFVRALTVDQNGG